MTDQSSGSSGSASATQVSAQAVQPIASSTTSELTALLRSVLENVNREVKSNVVLNGKAAAAVFHYQVIAADLKTLADKP